MTGPFLRRFVHDTAAPELTDRFDNCVTALGSFRLTHRARGALYLRSRPTGGVARASTGLTIGADDDPTVTFERAMNERIVETQAAMLRPGRRRDSSGRGLADNHHAGTWG